MDNKNRRTLLVVDDALTSRVILKKIFSGQYDVLEAKNGALALELLKKRRDVALVLLDIVMPEMDGFGVLTAMQADPDLKELPVIVMTGSSDEETQMAALSAGAMDVLYKPINPQVTQKRVGNLIARMDAVRLSERARAMEHDLRQADTDVTAGIYNKNAFLRRSANYLAAHPDREFVLMRWDIDNFKVYNDVYGTEAGDEYLHDVGDYYRSHCSSIPGLIMYARYEAEHFVCLFSGASFDPDTVSQMVCDGLKSRGMHAFDFSPRIGFYRVSDATLDVALMCDRALLALRSIKNEYGKLYAWYESSMRGNLIREHEIVNQMKSALRSGQFKVFFQPQYDYTDGTLSGAEALVRWIHPEKGMVSPAEFIPIFESNGFIYELDRCIWEQTCAYIKRWNELQIHIPPISVSVNISRKDLYQPNIVDYICSLPAKYGLDPSSLHLEVTESAYIDNPEQLVRVVKQLRDFGFSVEMDDFGSGYSSLNTLKNVPVDILKLDMKFLSQSGGSGRGGRILSSVVRMANEIDLPVIAEGVETRQQAEFLKSIGCYYMQGYYFARPMAADEFEKLLGSSKVSDFGHGDEHIGVDGAAEFMDSDTQTTLLFNSYVGGAAILEYNGGKLAALRMNDRLFEAIGMERRQYDTFKYDVLSRFATEVRAECIAAIEGAIRTGGETSCEMPSKVSDTGEVVWTRNRFRCLTKKAESYILYASVENITERKRLEARDEMYRNITLNFPVGIAVYELGDSIRPQYVNERVCEMFGFTAKEYAARIAAGMPVNFMPADDSYPPEVRARIMNGEVVEIPKLLAKRQDGSGFWLRAIMHLVRNEGQKPLLYTTLVDITERDEERNEAAAIADLIPGGTFCFSPETDEIRYISRPLLDMLGFSDEEFADRFRGSFTDIVWPDDRGLVWAKLHDGAAAVGDSTELDHRFVTAAGVPKWFHTAGRVISDPAGRPWFVVVVTDIDRRKKLEVELARGKKELETIVNSIPGGVATYTLQPDGLHLVYASDGVCSLSGRTADEYRQLMESGRGRDIIHEADRDHVYDLIYAARDTGGVVDANYRVNQKDGGCIWVKVLGRFSGVKDGYPLFFAVYQNLSYMTDIYQRLLDETDNALIVTDRDTREILFVNEAAAKLVGRSKEEALGCTCYGFFKNADKPCEPCVSDGADGGTVMCNVEYGGRHLSARISRIDWNGREALMQNYADRTEEWNERKMTGELLANIPGGLAVFRVENYIPIREFLSSGAAEILGYAAGEAPLTDMVTGNTRLHPEDMATMKAKIAETLPGLEPFSMDMRIYPSSGELRWVNLRANPGVSKDGEVRYFGLYSDVTERKRMEEEMALREQEYRMAAEQSDVKVYRYYTEGRTARFAESAGSGAETARDVSDYPDAVLNSGAVAPESVDAWRAFFASIDGGDSDGVAEIRKRGDDGDFRWLRFRFTAVYGDDGKPFSAFVSYCDVTRDRERFINVQLLADTDGMTGLYNRSATQRIVSELLGVDGGRPAAFILLDVDDLKGINDSYGHPQGDRALIGVAQTLKKHFRSTDIIGRVGGDEFVVMLSGVEDETAFAPSLRALMIELASIRAGEQNEYSIHCSIGCVMCRAGEDDFDSVYRRADMALYHVKRHSKNDYAFYTPEMESGRYVFTRHTTVSLRDRVAIDPAEAVRLMDALAVYYPLVISVNLTQDAYTLMESSSFVTALAPAGGSWDGFVRTMSNTFRADHRRRLLESVARDALLAVYAEGRPSLQLLAPQVSDADGESRWVEITVVFYKNADGDVCDFTFARLSDTVQREEELTRLDKIRELAVHSSFEYICLLHPDAGTYELYGNDGENSHDIPKHGNFDEVTRHIRDRLVVPEQREAYYENAPIHVVVARMEQRGGCYSYRYELVDGMREAEFYWFEPTHRELLMTVRRVSGK